VFTLLEQAAEQLRKACETCGFFYLIGHGVATELTQNALNASRQFFALPEGDKLSAYNYDGVILDDPPNFRGYRSLGQVALDPNNQVERGDTKEQWSMGRECGPGTVEATDWPDLHGNNAWPGELACPGFRDTQLVYFQEMWELARRLNDLVAISLHLPKDTFKDKFSSPTLTMALNHYSAELSCPGAGILGCGAHTDYGQMTILLLDSVPGLQIAQEKGVTDDMEFPVQGAEQACDRGWLDVPAMEGAFVVNTGDMMQRFTNGKYLSNMHRVVNFTGQERYSIAFFYEPNAECMVECLQTCYGPDNPPRYSPTMYGTYLCEKYKATGEQYEGTTGKDADKAKK